MFAFTILDFNDEIKIANMPKNIMVFCDEFIEKNVL
jgi:hypothetical protein